MLGLSSVFLFLGALVVLGNLNEDFSFANDFVSKLGATGAPNALWWNLLGFVLVGVLLMGFGIIYGAFLRDRLTGGLLALFGAGFVFVAIPFDFVDSNSATSKAHFIAVCLALGCWLCGLARMSHNQLTDKTIRRRANVAAVAIVLAIIGFVTGLWTMPMTHRMVFGVVFGWTAISSIYLLKTS